MKTILALFLFGGACLSQSGRAPKQVLQLKLENDKVKVTEVTSPPGGARARGVRAADQVIVFLDDCRYQRTDPKTGEKTIRERKSGDVIWHGKGEDAPLLVNVGSKSYRTLVIELKR